MGGQSSGWGDRAPREIKNDPSYDEQVETVGFPIDVLDQMLSGLFDTIATVPEEFDKVPGRDLYAADYIGRPRMRIWFTFDQRTVYLLGIERLD